MALKALCRLCAGQCFKYFSFFDRSTEKSNLLDKIKQCLHIEVTLSDELPKVVCYECYLKVETFYAYFNSCHEAQTTLIEMCKKKKSDTDILTQFSLAVNEPEMYELEEFKLDEKGQIECEDVECLLLENEDQREKNASLPLVLNEPVDGVGVGKTTDVAAGSCEERVSACQPPTNPTNSRNDSQDERTDHEDDLFDFDNSPQPPSAKKLFEDYIWKCTDCSKEFPTMPQLRVHFKEVHDKAPSFKCMKCFKVYDRYRSFARHVKLHTDSKKYSCEICGKCFAQKAVLQAHSTVHSEERPHVCPQCGKAFKQFSSLYLHSKCHLPEQAKPKYPCSLCFKLFSSKHSLETHMRIHTGEKNFICDVCGKRFVSKGSLDYHMLAHNDAKPHSCQICGKCFKTARLLGKHSTIHTGLKPHQCDVCGKQFRERGALKEHNRIHTGALPYPCQYCGKSFRFKGILTVHIRQHTGERPYSCGECRRDFTNWANYNKHMKRRHKGGVRGGGGASAPAPPAQSEAGGDELVEGAGATGLSHFLDLPPPPPPPPSQLGYVVEQPPPPPPPPYKLPLLPSAAEVGEDDLFRGQQEMSPFPSSPPTLPLSSYFIHPLHGLLSRSDLLG